MNKLHRIGSILLGTLFVIAAPAQASYKLEFPDTLQGGNAGQGEGRTSPNGAYSFIIQPNCDVSHYYLGQYTGWSTETATSNPNVSCFLAMQNDGNLVLYKWERVCFLTCSAYSWRAKWNSETNGNPGAFLQVQDDGNVVIYAADQRTPLWSIWYGRAY